MDRYRLAPVRDARARDERVKRGELASAVGDARATQTEIDAARRRVADLRARLARAVAERANLVTTAPRPALLALADRFVARLRADLDSGIGAQLRAEAAHAGKLAVVDEARGRLAMSRADREVIERHFTAWRDAKQKRDERREE